METAGNTVSEIVPARRGSGEVGGADAESSAPAGLAQGAWIVLLTAERCRTSKTLGGRGLSCPTVISRRPATGV
jgi:hypothetical protein